MEMSLTTILVHQGKGRLIMTNKFLTLIFAAALLFMTNVRADIVNDTVNFGWIAANNDVYKSTGLLESLQLTATNTGSGVTFTYYTTYTDGKNNEGAGKIMGNGNANDATGEFYIWNTGNIFMGGDGISTGGSMQGGSAGSLGTADYTASVDGFTKVDGVYQVSFTLAYNDNKGWDDFMTWITDTDNFTVGTHLQGLVNGNSAKVLTGGWAEGGFAAPPTSPTNATPEPATMLIVGLGLAGLGGLAARRKRK